MLVDGKREQWLNFTDEMKTLHGSCHKKRLEKQRADEPLLIYFTSGTTGQPKGAILTQQNLIQDARNIIQTQK
jgi:long-subunit acyl-CoA synthetase (AMP-forming)